MRVLAGIVSVLLFVSALAEAGGWQRWALLLMAVWAGTIALRSRPDAT